MGLLNPHAGHSRRDDAGRVTANFPSSMGLYGDGGAVFESNRAQTRSLCFHLSLQSFNVFQIVSSKDRVLVA